MGRRGADHGRGERIYRRLFARKRGRLRFGNQSHAAHGRLGAAYSGVNTESFMRKITYQELTRGGLEALAPTITAMAEAEGLDAHANAVRIRTEGGAR